MKPWLSVQWLEQQAKSLALTYWNLPFHIPVKINSRLRATYGLYRFSTFKGTKRKSIIPKSIELSASFLQHADEETVLGVLKHELCHWFLSTSGKPFNDGDTIFIQELNRIGAYRTRQIHVSGTEQKKTCWRAACSSCQQVVYESFQKKTRDKKLEGTLFLSGCCRVPLVDAGKRIIIK